MRVGPLHIRDYIKSNQKNFFKSVEKKLIDKNIFNMKMLVLFNQNILWKSTAFYSYFKEKFQSNFKYSLKHVFYNFLNLINILIFCFVIIIFCITLSNATIQ